MLSSMELQHVIESAFLPLQCKTEINPDGAMTITIVGLEAGSKSLTVAGILISSLSSARAIAMLVLELKEEYRLWQIVEADQKRRRW
jgi:hypothetical protein